MAEIDFFYQNFWKYWNGALYLAPYLGGLVYLVYKKDRKLTEKEAEELRQMIEKAVK